MVNEIAVAAVVALAVVDVVCNAFLGFRLAADRKRTQEALQSLETEVLRLDLEVRLLRARVTKKAIKHLPSDVRLSNMPLTQHRDT